MIVIHIFQIHLNRINKFVTYKVLRYFCVYLTEIEAVDVHRHCVGPLQSILLTSCLSHASSKIKIEFGRTSFGTMSLLLENVKYPISSIESNKFSKYWYFDCCNDFEYTYTFSKRHADFPISLSTRLSCRNLTDRKWYCG